MADNDATAFLDEFKPDLLTEFGKKHMLIRRMLQVAAAMEREERHLKYVRNQLPRGYGDLLDASINEQRINAAALRAAVALLERMNTTERKKSNGKRGNQPGRVAGESNQDSGDADGGTAVRDAEGAPAGGAADAADAPGGGGSTDEGAV